MSLRSLVASAVARRLIIRLAVVGALLGLAVTSLQLFGDYQRGLDALEGQFDQLDSSYLPSLIENVWLDDAERIGTLLDGIVSLPSFVQAEIRTSAGTIQVTRGEAARSPLSRTYPLTRLYGGKPVDLGVLAVTADLSTLRRQAIRQLLFGISGNAVLLLALCGLLYMQVHRLVTRRLWAIAGQVARLGRLGPAQAPPLELGPAPPPDELTAVGEGLNRMQQELTAATAAIAVNEERYRELFARSPVSLWEEDFSEVSALLDTLRPSVADIRAHLDAHPDFVRECAARVKILAVNEATITMHRAQNADELCSRLAAIFTPASFEGFKPQLAAIWNGESDVTVTSEVRTLDGDIRDVVVRWHTPPAHRTAYERVIISQEDITDMKAAQRSAEITMEKLMQAKAELERFTFVASHDLREPVRSIISFSQLLERSIAASGPLPQEAADYIAYLKAAAARMQAQVSGLYDYARAGQPAEQFQTVSLNDSLDDARLILRDRLAATGARITTASLPAVSGNRPQLAELFRHLLDNSIKFCRPETIPDIAVTATRAGEFWMITVRDNGIGIDPLYAAGVFDVFRRLHGPAQFPGAGLGLSICRRIVESHGGHISIDTTVSQGAAMILLLPAAESDAQATAPPASL
jgi:signal transduction histidine kinase